MTGKVLHAWSLALLVFAGLAVAQNQLDPAPFDPAKDPNPDMYMGNWRESMPVHTHGSLIERAVLTKCDGDPMKPPRKGAVLKFVNRFSYATLYPGASTASATLQGEQEVFYILSGKGAVKTGRKTADLYEGICVLMPAGLPFTITSAGSDALTMYLINEPIPRGFRPNKDMLVKDENTTPVASTNVHWCHIAKPLFGTGDGLGTLQSVATCTFDPMTIGHPHSHVEGCEEVWTAITGESIAFLGKQIRKQSPGMGFLIPPNGNTPHSNINISERPVKMLYFARYSDHDVRK